MELFHYSNFNYDKFVQMVSINTDAVYPVNRIYINIYIYQLATAVPKVNHTNFVPRLNVKSPVLCDSIEHEYSLDSIVPVVQCKCDLMIVCCNQS